MPLSDAIDRRFSDAKSLADFRDRCVGLRVQARDLSLLLLVQLAACPRALAPAATRLARSGFRTALRLHHLSCPPSPETYSIDARVATRWMSRAFLKTRRSRRMIAHVYQHT